MNYEAIILLLLSCLGFYIKIKYGVIIVSFWLLSILFNFFFTTFGMNIFLEELPECQLFYISKKTNKNFYMKIYNYFIQYKKSLNYPTHISLSGYFMIIRKKIKIN